MTEIKNKPGISSAGRIVQSDRNAKAEGAIEQDPATLPGIAVTPEESKLLNNQSQQSIINSSATSANSVASIGGNTNAIKPTLDNAPGRILKEGAPGSTSPDIFNKKGKKNQEEVDSKDTVFKEGASPVASEFIKNITARPNIFTQFASMTYSISIYLMNPQQYTSMISTGNRSVQGLTLIMQSAGIDNNDSIVNGNFGAIRSEFFPVDFYIDKVELKGLVSGTSVNAPHNVFEMSFTITEPNDLSFLERLHGAVQQYNINEGISKDRINYAAQNFLMVVRFYGYDQHGKIVSGSDLGVVPGSDTTSITEKFIPFQFSGIQFGIANQFVEYRCKAVAPQTQAISSARSTIPFNVELEGQTLHALFNGPGDAATVLQLDHGIRPRSDDTGLSFAFIEKHASGLTDSLNEHYKREAEKKNYEIPDEYIIFFEKDSKIDRATVAKPGITEKERTSMSPQATASDKLLTSKGSVNKDRRLYSVTAGMSILQFIDLVMRTSSYITSQQNFVIDEVTGEAKLNGASNKVLQWYKIRTEVTPIGYDNKRNDYAYRMKYIVSRYLVNNVRTPYFPIAKYRGVHKKYNYWFTGENTEVLNFTQDYNYLYFQSFGPELKGLPKLQNNAREIEKRYYQASSAESSQGGKNKSNEPAANAAEILYSPADQAQAKLEILGDPDWIAQSEIFYGADKSLKDVGLGPFMTDGSVNYDASEVLFSINYNTNTDYNLFTGIANVGKDNYGQKLDSGIPGDSRISLVYRANTITTKLSKGKFTQELEGTLMLFPTEEQRVKQNTELAGPPGFQTSNVKIDPSAGDALTVLRARGHSGNQQNTDFN